MKKNPYIVLFTLSVLFAIMLNFLLSFSFDSISYIEYYTNDCIYAVYPEALEKQSCAHQYSEKLTLPKKELSFEELLSNCRVPSSYKETVYTTMIDALKRDRCIPYLDETDFFKKAFFPLVATIEESTMQYTDTTQEFGFTVTKVKPDYLISVDKDGELVKVKDSNVVLKAGKEGEGQAGIAGDFSSFYLLETYYEKNDTLYTSLGTKQKPLQPGHQYLINVLHLAANFEQQQVYDERLSVVNVAPLYTELPVCLFDEKNFYDMNDLEENEEYLERLKSTGLYEDYEETQYTTGKNLIKTVNDLPITEYQLPELPTDEKPTTDVEPNEDRAAWLLPVLIGAGALVCVVPTAVILIMKKRKKAAVREVQMTSPTDPPTG